MLLKFDNSLLHDDVKQSLEVLKVSAMEKFFSLRNKTCEGSEYTGWWDLPEQSAFENLKQIREYCSKIDVPFDLIVVIGIGGSYAGTKAVSEALRHSYADRLLKDLLRYTPIVYAGHNLSEQGMIEVLDLIEEHDPIINVISKSGGTIEPNVAFRIVEETMIKRFGQEAKKRILVTTQNDENPLCELAKKRQYALFPIPQNVGGRYSVFTAAGLLPLLLAGYDTEQLLNGADRLFSELRSGENPDHEVISYASYRKYAWDAGKSMEILAYKEPKLLAFIEWWKQLFGESEGKDGKGLMPIGMSYTTDLHSLGQFVQEGPLCMIETFLNLGPAASLIERRLKIPSDDRHGIKSISSLSNRYISEIEDAAWEASKKAHTQHGVPCVSLTLTQLDEYHLGYLLAFFQVACAVSGLMLEVNPFNQPGVEVYKKEMHTLLHAKD